MRQLMRVGLGATLVAALAMVTIQTGIGQTINGSCPYLQTDGRGFPLNPPYSQYGTDSNQPTLVSGQFFDLNSPCCGTLVVTTNSTTGAVTTTATLSGNPAQFDPISGSSFCQPPEFDLTEGPAPDPIGLNTTVNPFFNRAGCPQMVDFTLTVEVNGAVKNCTPPGATLPDTGGGSNFLAQTGANGS